MTGSRTRGNDRSVLEAAADDSWVVGLGRTLRDATGGPVERAADGSTAVAVHRRLRSLVASSRIVTWFRRRPVSEPIVLDPRRSRTIGWAIPPFASVLGRSTSRLGSLRSKLRPGRTAPLVAGLRHSRLVAAVSAFLAPPEPGRTDERLAGEDRE